MGIKVRGCKVWGQGRAERAAGFCRKGVREKVREELLTGTGNGVFWPVGEDGVLPLGGQRGRWRQARGFRTPPEDRHNVLMAKHLHVDDWVCSRPGRPMREFC